MSLDYYIITKNPVQHKHTGIYIRENGETKELSKEEAEKKFNQPVEEYTSTDSNLLHVNITHNLAKMAKQCEVNGVSLYTLLWYPDEVLINGKPSISYCQNILILYIELKAHRETYEKFNPSNGWGSYDSLLNALKKIAMCFINNYISDLKVEASI